MVPPAPQIRFKTQEYRCICNAMEVFMVPPAPQVRCKTKSYHGISMFWRYSRYLQRLKYDASGILQANNKRRLGQPRPEFQCQGIVLVGPGYRPDKISCWQHVLCDHHLVLREAMSMAEGGSLFMKCVTNSIQMLHSRNPG